MHSLMVRLGPLCVLLLIGCGDDAPETKAAPATVRTAPTDDPCIAIRAEFFRRMSMLELIRGAVAGNGAINDPWLKVEQDNYKLEHPKCFF
jgi:hypothetical protein